MCRIVVLLVCAFWLLNPIKASAWDFQGHRVVGSIADQMLTDNARTQVQQILNEGAPPDPKKDLTLRLAGPWADCVRSVKNNNGNFEYVVDPDHLEYEVPCIPFRSKAERERMEDYAKRNWTNCQNPPSLGCHTDYHFDDVDIERGGYDRSYQGTNDHDLVAATRAAPPAPVSIQDKKEEGSPPDAGAFRRRPAPAAPCRRGLSRRKRQAGRSRHCARDAAGDGDL